MLIWFEQRHLRCVHCWIAFPKPGVHIKIRIPADESSLLRPGISSSTENAGPVEGNLISIENSRANLVRGKRPSELFDFWPLVHFTCKVCLLLFVQTIKSFTTHFNNQLHVYSLLLGLWEEQARTTAEDVRKCRLFKEGQSYKCCLSCPATLIRFDSFSRCSDFWNRMQNQSVKDTLCQVNLLLQKKVKCLTPCYLNSEAFKSIFDFGEFLCTGWIELCILWSRHIFNTDVIWPWSLCS